MRRSNVDPQPTTKPSRTNGTAPDEDSSGNAEYVATWPSKFDVPMAWTGTNSKLEESGQYMLELNDYQRAEIDQAFKFFKRANASVTDINPQTFPLPNLQSVLHRIAVELHNGLGFFWIRGLDRGRYSYVDNMIITLGINSYIANQITPQDAQGNMIIHVMKDHSPGRNDHVRHSETPIPFHTDKHADILAFWTVQTAETGGGVVLTSAYAIYNELAQSYPDVIKTLAEPNWAYQSPRFGEPCLRPVLMYHDGRLLASVSPERFQCLTPKQKHAWEIFESLAEKHKFIFRPRAGDLHFANNLGLVHRRDGFRNAGTLKRHLVRFQLRNGQLGWKIPEVLNSEAWLEMYDLDGTEQWHIEPKPEQWIAARYGGN